jgi:hypothetical protein
MTLSVVYVPDTGHVVAALAVTGGQAPDDVSTLVGPAIPLRVTVDGGETAELTLLAGKLAGLAADDEPGVFGDPLAFGVDQVVTADQQVIPRPTLLSLDPLTDAPTLDATGLTVTVPRIDPVNDAAVLVLISDGPDTRTVPWLLPKGDKTVTIPVTVDDGEHGVLVLVAGWAGTLQAVSKA